MPIPLFLVYDGFEKVLDAVMVYKQVNALVNQEEPNILAPFCIPSGMHAIYNPKWCYATTCAHSQVFMAAPTTHSKSMGSAEAYDLFPCTPAYNTSQQQPYKSSCKQA